MKRVGFKVGTDCSKKHLTGIGRVAKNTIENILEITNEYQFMMLEKDRIGVDIPADTAATTKDSGKMVSLQCLTYQLDIMHSFYDPCTNFEGKTKKILNIYDLVNAKYPQWISGDKSYCEYWKNRLQKAATNADIVIVDSEYTKEDVINTFNLPKKKVRRVYCGLDRRLDNSVTEENEYDRKWRSVGRYMLSVCTIEPRKNLNGALKAFKIYKEHHRDDDIKLVIVGKVGWVTEPIFAEINNSPFRDDIIITGYVTDAELLSLYKNCLFSVYASFFEGFGLPILESLSLGKTVVCSNTSSMPEVGEDAVCYCNPYDIESIADAMEKLSQNDEYRSQLENKAKSQAAKFSYKQAAIETLNIYDELL